jgi:signal transduction histidine kinase
MTQQSPARESLLELYDALAQRQLRDAGAEVAAAIAHAVGTPLNVISGRAELIRQDPSNALTQVARIEEQVKKLATGLRQLVDYLAVPDPRAAQPSASGPSTHGAGVSPALSMMGGASSAPNASGGELAVVDAKSVLDDVVALTEALARANHVEVVADDGGGLAGARVERWHALGTLGTLVSHAIQHCVRQHGVRQYGVSHVATKARQGSNGAAPRVSIGGSVASQGVTFELVVPGLSPVQGWQLEHFQARPAAIDGAEFYRTISICAAVVRGHGGKLMVESAPNGEAIVVRFSCVNEAS